MRDNPPRLVEEVAAHPADVLALQTEALWRHLAEASSVEVFAEAWLTLQCSLLTGATFGLMILGVLIPVRLCQRRLGRRECAGSRVC